MGILRAYAELGRVSNLPTCISNTLVGLSLGAAVSGDALSPQHAILVSFVIALFYFGGMALNDVADLEWDRQHGPHRPIAAGRVSLQSAMAVIVLCFAFALTILDTFAPRAMGYACLLLGAIIAYDLLHKRHPTSVLIMGSCRGLVYLTAAATIATVTSMAWWFAAIITFYTMAITIVARAEHLNKLDTRRWIAVAMPIVVLLAIFLQVDAISWTVIIGGILMTIWLSLAAQHVLAKPPQTKNAVLKWLSGMCLIDAYLLCVLGQPIAALVAGGCFVVTTLGHRKILGT